MPDLFDLIKKWWKQLFLLVALSLLAVGVITFLKPVQYVSTATAVASSALNTDKSKIFNQNIQALYSSLGSPDELDMIIGTANLDTIYLAVANSFNLYDHYKNKENGTEGVIKSAAILKENTKIMKSEFGELKVKVWDTDKNLAPQLANALLDQLQKIHSDLINSGNQFTLVSLQEGKKKIESQLDSLAMQKPDLTKAGADRLAAKQQALSNQLSEYEKLVSQYQLLADSKPAALLVVEKAKASLKPDRPKRLQIMVATLLLSLLFGLFAILLLERRKTISA